MARASDLEKMSYADLNKMEAQIVRLKVGKQDAERKALRDKVVALVKAQGFEMSDLFGRGSRKGKGTVAVKYRDPGNPRKHLDRPRAHAALDGLRDQGWQGQEGRFSDLRGRRWMVPAGNCPPLRQALRVHNRWPRIFGGRLAPCTECSLRCRTSVHGAMPVSSAWNEVLAHPRSPGRLGRHHLLDGQVVNVDSLQAPG